MTFQVARVKKALGSLSQMVKNENKLVIDQDSSGKETTSYIQNKRTNEKISLRRENGVHVLDLMVAPPHMSNDRSIDPHFSLAGIAFTTPVSLIKNPAAEGRSRVVRQ